eukprot:gnl/MRDRNA2_/MRDRNA2_68892_c0_seq1.p1 gnl/MRDRNA2_/MRDRNA2_68892_c0~~gnl/MRDRNA2_/MRDRNA2_68892_c0_seq1.p1  ORF type:complete len:192 (+),score=12.36 gnl/MRDRNA2_/MRDRNA2_68892_c0_seq1:121-696(+)
MAAFLRWIREHFGPGSSIQLGVDMQKAVKRQPKVHILCGVGAHLKFSILAVVAVVWLFGSTGENKIRAVLLGSVYSCIEYSWNWLLDGVGHTTKEQWVANFFYLPVGFFSACRILYMLPAPLFVVFFPANIFLLEIIEGYIMMIVFDGCNPAWIYNTWDGFCHGNCRWLYAPVWCGMGVIVWFLAGPLGFD